MVRATVEALVRGEMRMEEGGKEHLRRASGRKDENGGRREGTP